MTRTLFLHIHKTGGTTLRHMLHSVVPYAKQYPTPLDYQSKGAPYRTHHFDVPDVMSLMAENDLSEFDLFMGHYDWQVVACLGDDVTVLTLLRDPIEQLYSHYRYFWVDRHYRQYKMRYQSSGVYGFLTDENIVNFANQQTRFLSGRIWNHDADDLNSGVLSYAKRNLRKCVYGLLDRWGDSIALFEQHLGVRLPSLDIMNANRTYRPAPFNEREYEQAQAVQSYDISLYEYAVKHFEEQF